MKLKELREFINSLPKSYDSKEVAYNSKALSISGTITSIKVTTENLYWKGDDDPAPLYTKDELKAEGMDNEEISECEIEIKKGNILIEI